MVVVPQSLVITVLVIEGIVLVLLVGALLSTAAWRSATGARRARRLQVARDTLRRVVSGDEAPDAGRRQLLRLPRALQVTAFGELAVNLSGERLAQLGRLAEEAGLTGRALRGCRSRRWFRRLRAVRLLSLLGSGSPTVADRLHDRHSEVRAAAATSCAGHGGVESVHRLLGALDDDSPLVRFAAKDALLRIGRAAVPPIAARLQARDALRLDAVLEVALGMAEPRLLGPALAFTRDPSSRTRQLALRVVGAVGGASAVQALEAGLADPAAEVRGAAAEALGALGHWPAGPRLVLALGDPAWSVRRGAGLALRALGGPGALLLRRALSAEDRFARDMARQVLDLPDPARRSVSA
jgi:HEAT repeat protein